MEGVEMSTAATAVLPRRGFSEEDAQSSAHSSPAQQTSTRTCLRHLSQDTMSAPRYNRDLRAEVQTSVSSSPAAKVHRVEWVKVMNGSPVEINPSFGSGFKVMSVDEWAARWKNNEDFPECLSCKSKATKEHYFVQTWCRGRKRWESECLCLGCHKFSFRSYCDPDFLTPEEYEKQHWEGLTSKA